MTKVKKLPRITIKREDPNDEIDVHVNGKKVPGVAGVSLGMSEIGSVVTVVIYADQVTVDAQLNRLVLGGADETELGEPT